jgi:DnaJ-class molecular chaperone
LSGDPYQILGIAKNGSAAEITKAYRGLAKKLHPDLNPGNKGAEERFKEVSSAYDLLKDPEKRACFDRGEIDSSGAARPQHHFYRDFAGAEAGSAYSSDTGYADFGNIDEILSGMFERDGKSTPRGQDVSYHLDLDFLDAVNGAKRQITLPDGSGLEVSIPPGMRDGQVLRLRGKGRPGVSGAAAGDALIEVSVRPHGVFSRKGDDIHIEVPVSLKEAVLGGRIEVPTPSGSVAMRVPKWANTGTVLRLKGKGVARPGGSRGDEYVALKVMLPERPDLVLEQFVAQWDPADAERSRQTTEA